MNKFNISINKLVDMLPYLIFSDKVPLYFIPIFVFFPIIFGSFLMQTSKKEKTVRFFRIKAKCYSQIEKFMDYLKELQPEFIDSTSEKNTYKFFNYDMVEYKWTIHEINVNKTFDNIFLET